MTVPMPVSARFVLLAFAMLCMAQIASAQTRHAPPAEKAAEQAAPGPLPELDVSQWLQRMHNAARQSNYVGTFVVSAAVGSMSSARIWHACEDDLQVERVEALTGPPRSTFRRNDRVLTFLPEARVVKSEKRENLELFPNLLGVSGPALADFYDARLLGKGRVAGFDADLVHLVPRDALRFGYRVWSERRSGLVIKLQTLDGDGRVVEQSAFSELQLDAPISAKSLEQMMSSTAGYRVEKTELKRTTPEAEGWTMSAPVAGFRHVNAYRRLLASSQAGPGRTHVMQWIFSDGLASVSLFIEPYDAERTLQEGVFALGATHTVTRRLTLKDGQWWLTAVGEVPVQTLDVFAQSLARR